MSEGRVIGAPSVREAIVTHEGDAVVFSVAQASEVFFYLPHGRLCLCVDVPRCLWVASVADAQKFYESSPDELRKHAYPVGTHKR